MGTNTFSPDTHIDCILARLVLVSAMEAHLDMLPGRQTAEAQGKYRQQQSLAALLPEEAVTCIMEYAVGDHGPWDIPEDVDELPSMCTLQVITRICKAWEGPAKRAFYKDIPDTALWYPTQAILLYDTLRHANPHLGKYIHSFDPGSIFEEGPIIAFQRLLDTMPELEELSAHVHQLEALSSHPQWNRLKTLQLRQHKSGEHLLHLGTKQFPMHLVKLIVDGETDLLGSEDGNAAAYWAQLHLPQVKSFIISNSKKGQFTPVQPRARRLLPIMASLNSLEILTMGRSGHLSLWIIQIIGDVADTIKRLTLRGNECAFWPLLPFVATSLKKLEVLEYEGPSAPDYVLTAGELPATLRKLDIEWTGPLTMAQNLLDLMINDKDFLPNLTHCPRLVHAYNSMFGQAPTREEIEKMYEHAARAYNIMKKRPNISGREVAFRLSRFRRYADVFCLPSPLPYLDALEHEQRQVPVEMVAAGKIGGYSE